MIAGPAPRTYVPFGYEGGVGAAAGMSAMTSPGSGSSGPKPGPGFGYPFRMPANFGSSGLMSMP